MFLDNDRCWLGLLLGLNLKQEGNYILEAACEMDGQSLTYIFWHFFELPLVVGRQDYFLDSGPACGDKLFAYASDGEDGAR